MAAELVLNTSPLAYERAMERVRSYAHLKVGWYDEPVRRVVAQGLRGVGGPVPQSGIDEACEIIAWCQAHGVAAPSVYPTPLHPDASGVSLEWGEPDVWAEWIAPGEWELVADSYDGFEACAKDVRRALEVTP
jgi:hypothetical protein